MIDQARVDLPTAPIDLSAKMREIRARQGLKQSEVARRMGLDPSIPSLWEQGKRPVPSNRILPLADALGVAVSELLEGVGGGARQQETRVSSPAGRSVLEYTSHLGRDPVARERAPMVTLAALPSVAPAPPPMAVRMVEPPRVAPVAPMAPREPSVQPHPFVAEQRPPLSGLIPRGWEPTDRIQDIGPALPDGYWLDPVRVEKAAARALLRARLCDADRALVADQDVPGAALAERIYRHCGKVNGFVGSRSPLMETIFRMVLTSEYGGMTVDGLIDALEQRGGAVAVTRSLLRRMRENARAYPLRWVDRALFGQ